MESNRFLTPGTSKRQEIVPGVFLEKRQERVDNKLFTTIEVENKLFRVLDIKVDFSKSQNVQNVNGPDMFAQAQVAPFDKQMIARVLLEKNWNLKTSFKFSLQPPSLEIQRTHLRPINERIHPEVESTAILRGIDLVNIPEVDLFAFLNANGLKFVDQDFPPNNSSVFPTEEQTIEQLGYLVHWRRLPEALSGAKDYSPNEIFKPINEVKIDPNDVLQGSLGNCWLICVLSAIAEHPALIQRVFLTKKPNKYGLFKMKLCKMARWKVLVIDDYIPCFPLGGPIFATNQNPGYWVMLIEKAFAKLFGNYSRMVKGEFKHAMIDLTGCPAFSFILSKPNVAKQIDSGELWNNLKRWKAKNYILACGSKESLTHLASDSAGSNHAFSILKVFEDQNVKLLCIKDPWKIVEWKGDWCPDSPLWTPELVDKLQPDSTVNQSSFWISWKDFCCSFEQVSVCYTQQWEELLLKGKFVRSVSVENSNIHNCCSRWYYQLEVPEKTRVIIGVHQEDQKFLGADIIRPYVDLGIVLLQKGNSYKLVAHSSSAFERECYMELDLEAGVYYIVPRCLGICLDHHIPTGNYKGDFGPDDPLIISAIKYVFERYDIVCNDLLSFKELNAFFQLFNREISLAEYDKILNEFGRRDIQTGELEGLSEMSFVHLFFSILEGKSTEEKRELFSKLGFDDRLFAFRTRPFMLSLHSDIKLQLAVKDALEENMDLVASRLLLRKYGKNISTDESKIRADDEVVGFYYFNE
jgi:hypothetical protein